MIRQSGMAVLAAVSAALFTAPAAGQQAAPTSPQRAADPNEKICEDIVQTGSRLATRRICATRAEWDDRRRQDREAVEKAQLSPCVLTHTEVGANGNGHQAC
jgi:hypothetical protein